MYAKVTSSGGRRYLQLVEGYRTEDGKVPEGANLTFSAHRSQPSWNAAANGDTMVFARHDLGVCSV